MNTILRSPDAPAGSGPFQPAEEIKTPEADKVITVEVLKDVTLDGRRVPVGMSLKISVKQWRTLARHFKWISGPEDHNPANKTFIEKAVKEAAKAAKALAAIALLCILHSAFCISAHAQITNLGAGMKVATATYGLAPSTYLPATNNATNASGAALAQALAYIPSGSNVMFPLTNAYPANSTNWFLGTNGMSRFVSGTTTPTNLSPLLVLNLTKWDQVEIDTCYQVLTNTGAGTAATNWLFFAPSEDGLNFDTNHLITMQDVAYTNNTTAGSSGGLFRTNLNTTTTTGNTGYIGLVGVACQGTNSITNFQVIPVVKSNTKG
jgi:hypothetical protein